MVSKVQAIACSNTEFLFTVKYCSLFGCAAFCFLVCQFGRLFCVPLSLATGVAVQVFVGTYVFHFSWVYIPRAHGSENAKSELLYLLGISLYWF